MNVFAKFYDRTIKTNDINPETGLPVFKEVCFVEIRIKNNMTDVVDQPATPEKIARFKAEYQHYLDAKEKAKSGTPLNIFAFLSPLEIATLNAHGLYTLEEFVGLKRVEAEDLALLNEWEKAQSFLKIHQNQQMVENLKAENEALKKEIEALKIKLSESLKAPTSAPKIKRKKNASLKDKSDESQ